MSVLLFPALGTYVWPTSMAAPAIRMKSNPQPRTQERHTLAQTQLTHKHTHERRTAATLRPRSCRIEGVEGVALPLRARESKSNQEHLSASVHKNRDKPEVTKEERGTSVSAADRQTGNWSQGGTSWRETHF